jgi:hypothetical protein
MKLFFIYKKVQFEWTALIENFFKKKNRVKLIQKKLFDWKIETTYNWECFSSLSEKNHHKSQSTTISLGKVVYGKGRVKNNERHRAAKQKTWTYIKKKIHPRYPGNLI